MNRFFELYHEADLHVTIKVERLGITKIFRKINEQNGRN